MKNIIVVVFVLSLLGIEQVTAKEKPWPVLKSYDAEHLSRIALPIGGIGTGTVSLTGTGELRDWEIMNKPAKGFSGTSTANSAPFFAIYVENGDGNKFIKGLMGPVRIEDYEDMRGRKAYNHGIPRFKNSAFKTAYPFGVVNLSDPGMPVDVQIKGFNPLIPGNADDSGIPIAILRYEVYNKTAFPIDVSVCGSMENYIGMDGSIFNVSHAGYTVPKGAVKNRNQFRNEHPLKGIYMYSEGVDSTSTAWGTMALTTETKGVVSYKTTKAQGWGASIQELWDDLGEDGELKEKNFQVKDMPRAALAVKQTIPAYEKKEFIFYLTWHFPNRKAWAKEIVGNYYCTQYQDAWDVIEKVHPRLEELEDKSVDFVSSFLASDYPEEVKEAALFNMSTLRTQTCFRTSDGYFYGWEGCMDNVGSCKGSCTHVWNYEQTSPFMFAELARKMREVEFGYATDSLGAMSFRVNLPLDLATSYNNPAADGQMGTIMKVYREWQLSGDDDFLKELWPNIKKALAFSWAKGGWDGNMDGVMEGSQHNTMDVSYYGPNPQMQLWYLGALRAGEEMAKHIKDKAFAATCRNLFEEGSEWTDKNLFNGEYYKQLIQVPNSKEDIHPALRFDVNKMNLESPNFQLGDGCLVDQLVGQYMAHTLDLGYLVRPENVKTTLKSIMRYNYASDIDNHLTTTRSYAIGDEKALLMASFPYGKPDRPFPYYSEAMTGFEYAAAVGMLYEGLDSPGLKVIQNIRNRYDGRKRNPFNEGELGHHYARAMAAYGSVLAISGFNYSGVSKTIKFNEKEGKWFWANGTTYGMVELSRKGNGGFKVKLKVLGKPLQIKKIEIRGFGEIELKETKTIGTENEYEIRIAGSRG